LEIRVKYAKTLSYFSILCNGEMMEWLIGKSSGLDQSQAASPNELRGAAIKEMTCPHKEGWKSMEERRQAHIRAGELFRKADYIEGQQQKTAHTSRQDGG